MKEDNTLIVSSDTIRSRERRISDKETGIYELVKGISKELKKIKDDPEIQKNPTLTLKSLELGLNVTISKAGEGGLKFFVVTTGAQYRKEEINTVKLAFEPLVLVKPKKIELITDKGEPVLTSPITVEELTELLAPIVAQKKIS